MQRFKKEKQTIVSIKNYFKSTTIILKMKIGPNFQISSTIRLKTSRIGGKNTTILFEPMLNGRIWAISWV
jgi:hypothetical protein